MQQFDVILPVSGLRASCTKYKEKYPASIMASSLIALEEEIIVYVADVTHPDGKITHHGLFRDRNGHWQLNLLEDGDHKTNEELQKAIDQYEAGEIK